MNDKCPVCKKELEYHKKGLCEDCKDAEHKYFCTQDSPCQMCQEKYVRGSGKSARDLMLEIASRDFIVKRLPVGYVLRISLTEDEDSPTYDWYFTKSCALTKVLGYNKAPRMGWFYTSDEVCDFILQNEGLRPKRCANCGRDLTKPNCECGHDNRSNHVHDYKESDKCVKCGKSCI